MKCPACSHDDDRVLDSRPARDGEAIRRRRECAKCGERFTTYEYIERNPLTVVKRDGRREPYDRGKLMAGIELACRKRPASRADVEKLVLAVEAGLAEENRSEVSSRELGERVLEQLRTFDQVAYVRFASVYRQFDSPEKFAEELRGLAGGGNSARPEE